MVMLIDIKTEILILANEQQVNLLNDIYKSR